jgi:hypothetical protein
MARHIVHFHLALKFLDKSCPLFFTTATSHQVKLRIHLRPQMFLQHLNGSLKIMISLASMKVYIGAIDA